MFSLHTLYVLLRNQKSQTDKIQFNKKKIQDCRIHFFLKTIDTVTRYKLLRDVGICSKFSRRFLVMGNYTQIQSGLLDFMGNFSKLLGRNERTYVLALYFLLAFYYSCFLLFFFFFRVSKFYDRFIICARLRHTEMILQQIIQRFITITIIIVFSILY